MHKTILTLTVSLVFSFIVQAQSPSVFSTPAGAIRGFDPVAYFTEGKAVKGDSSLVYNWNDAAWHFSSRQNLDSFTINPQKYAPQYGGYCAYGLSAGHKSPTEPDAWTIVDGKLYLNYNTNVQQAWKKKQAACIEAADKNWPALKDK